MTKPYLLDTNAYFLLFQRPKSLLYNNLLRKIQENDGTLSFYISEITSMEIRSVIGKYRRGAPPQKQTCARKVMQGSSTVECTATWIYPGRKPIKLALFRDIQKLLHDIEIGKGSIQATVLHLTSASIVKAQELLIKYADRYNHGSHDALIAGSVFIERDTHGLDLTLITSDKGLKSVLKDELISFYDPAS